MAAILAGLGMLAGPGRALAQRPLGIDVSHWDGAITWTTVKSSGITFAWAKASEGVWYADDTFLNNEANGTVAGVPIGAYHFAEYNNDLGTSGAVAEANYFWSVAANYIKGGGYYLVPMLDLENIVISGTSYDPGHWGYTTATFSQWANAWCQTVSNNAALAGVTVKPVIYTGVSFASSWLDSTVAQWPLWMANWNGQDPQTGGPNGTSPWSMWTVWQYSASGAVPGVPVADCDKDVFNGTWANLVTTLVIGGTFTNPPPPPPPPNKVVGLFDLGPAGPTGLANPGGNGVKQTYIVDVSKDGTLAGGTDSSGNAFLWTSASGKVSIGTGYSLVGVDWYNSTNVLAVANNWGYTTTRPWYWQGYYNGTNGSWTQLPGAGASTGTAGYWFGTGLGITNGNVNWWVSGYTTNTLISTSPGHKQGVGYDAVKNYSQIASTSSTTNWNANGNSGHDEMGFYGTSDAGWMVGTEQYGGAGTPGSGSTHGCYWTAWYDVSIKPRPHWLGPPENSGKPNTSTVTVSGAISADGTIKGGTDKSGAIYWGLWWDNASPIPNVYKVPQLFISGTTHSDWMEVHSLNKDGTVMGGDYYRTDAADAWYEAFVCYRSGTTITSTNKVGDLLHAYGLNTNGWTFNDVTGLSDDGNTLVGYGVTNSVTHAWLAQLPAPVVHITHTSLDGLGNMLISFTSSRIGDYTNSFAIQQCGTVNGTYADVSPAAAFTAAAGSFQATVPQSGDIQFYRIRHL
jgi:GH25 family lysozyme M1 (1,4-beta-N-acetylmuramidase)